MKRPRSERPLLALPPLLLLLGAGCNGVTAAVLGSDSGDSNASGSLAALSVTNTKESPARVRFVAIDQEGDALEVELYYRVDGGPERSLTALVGQANPASYEASEAGVVHLLDWDFAAEPQLQVNGEYIEGVSVFAVVDGDGASGGTVLLEGQNAATQLGLGNDAPAVAKLGVPAEESPGVVPVSFEASDSSGDVLDIRVEFDLANDFPDAGWQLARPSLQPSTPDYAIQGFVADADGVAGSFFWDTSIDMPDAEDDVRLRFTPDDGLAEGGAIVTEVFRVDNNVAPFASIEDASFDLNDDVYGGVPIPFTVSDVESDPIEVVFQWARPSEGFPDLSGFSSDELLAFAADPLTRAQYQICTEQERWATGPLRPSAPDAVRLTDIAETGSTLIANGFEQRVFEVLRPRLPLSGLAAEWSSSELSAPAAVATLDTSESVLVLDASGASSWRLIELALASGEIVREISTGAGSPRALAIDELTTTALVALVEGNGWRLERIDLASGSSLGSAAVDSSSGPRGLDTRDGLVAYMTAEDALLRVSFGSDPPHVATVASGLAEPWGVVVDPLAWERVLVAENGADRVLSVDARTGATTPLPAVPPLGQAGPAFSAPRAMTLENDGRDLLVVVQDDELGRALVLLPLRVSQDHFTGFFGDQLDDPVVFPYCDLPESAEGIASGPVGLHVSLDAAAGDLLVGGGVEQRRTVLGFDPLTHELRLDAAFDPPVDARHHWRMLDRVGPIRSTPLGVARSFAWDSSDAGDSTEVLFRLYPIDTEVGLVDTSSVPQPFRTDFDVDPLEIEEQARAHVVDIEGDGDLDWILATDTGPQLRLRKTNNELQNQPLPTDFGSVFSGIVTGDVDGDGDLDLVTAGDGGLQVLDQIGPALFAETAHLIPYPLSPNPGGELAEAAEVTVCDIDGDGDTDFVTANRVQVTDLTGDDSSISIYLQGPAGVWTASTLGDESTTGFPGYVHVADLDEDGDLDLAVPCGGCMPAVQLFSSSGCPDGEDRGRTVVFFQVAPGVFDSTPLVVGDPEDGANTSGVDSADVDGDGDRDLLVTYGASMSGTDFFNGKKTKTLSVFHQLSPGVYADEPLDLVVPSFGLGFADELYSPSAADFDGDGRMDLLATDGSFVYVWRGLGGGEFAELLELPAGSGGEGGDARPRPLIVDDLDGDGDLDLLVNAGTIEPSVSAPSVFLRVHLLSRVGGARSFSASQSVAAVGGGNALQGVAVADLDADGDMDLAGPNWTASIFGGGNSPDTLTVQSQSAARSFLFTSELGGPGLTPGIRFVRPGDMDGDGDLDLLQYSANFGYFRQTSPGEYEPEPVPIAFDSGLSFPAGVELLDMDADGDLDVVTKLGTGIGIATQVQPGVYEHTHTIPLTTQGAFNGVSAGDLDADGDADLAALVAVQSDLVIELVLQEGAGYLAQPETVLVNSTDNFAKGLYLRDCDGDGDGDFVLAANNPWVVIQEAPLEFRAQQMGTGSNMGINTIEGVRWGDADGDGDLDVVHSLGYFEQASPGWFLPIVAGNDLGGPQSGPGFFGDLDGDGAQDFVHGAGAFQIYWGDDAP